MVQHLTHHIFPWELLQFIVSGWTDKIMMWHHLGCIVPALNHDILARIVVTVYWIRLSWPDLGVTSSTQYGTITFWHGSLPWFIVPGSGQILVWHHLRWTVFGIRLGTSHIRVVMVYCIRLNWPELGVTSSVVKGTRLVYCIRLNWTVYGTWLEPSHIRLNWQVFGVTSSGVYGTRLEPPHIDKRVCTVYCIRLNWQDLDVTLSGVHGARLESLHIELEL